LNGSRLKAQKRNSPFEAGGSNKEALGSRLKALIEKPRL
jgi:hypothetical protein